MVAARISGADICRLISVGRPVVAIEISRSWVDCSSGIYHQSVVFGTNANPTGAQQAFRFYARRGAASVWSSVAVAIEGAPAFAHSDNWSGYIVPASRMPIFSVSGQWNVPTLNCGDTPNAGASTWVGIGGEGWATGGTSGSLLQTGIDTNCVNGAQQDDGWWELWPSNPNSATHFTDLTVSAGDSIKAGVYQLADGSWETRIDDLTTGVSGWMITGKSWGVGADSAQAFTVQGLTTGLNYQGGYTAEWIVEDYTSNGTYTPFVNFGTIVFSNPLINLLSGPSYRLTASDGSEIVQHGVVLARPSLATSRGFSVTYTGP